MNNIFHLYYFKVFLCLNIFPPKPQRAVCPVQLRLSFQFNSGGSSSDQFSSIHFNSLCFTWKWLLLLTASSCLLSLSVLLLACYTTAASPARTKRSNVSVYVVKKRTQGQTRLKCKGNNSFFFIFFSLTLSSCHQTAVIGKPHISKKSTFEE